MDDNTTEKDNLVDAVSDLVETYRNLITVRIIEHTSIAASISILGTISLFVTVFIMLFTGLGAAWWIGDSLNNMKAGFFIVGGFYSIILLILLLTANSVLIPTLRNLIIKKTYEQD